ncbi:MAG: CCA tRNA nucleotidyltransferase [Bdellovibrionota bacterium]
MKLNPELLKSQKSWPAVMYVCQELQSRGHLAYLAGGAVRDALLGKRPKDFDIATSARPHEVEQIFQNTVAVGKAFGVIVVIVDGPNDARVSLEVTTFRSDGDYKDGRRPDSIEYSTPEKDSERRDFTINALFYDTKTEKVIDFQEGLQDLLTHTIRAVGDPVLRFGEDKLRMLRAVRFAGQLGFKIEDTTLAAVKKLHHEINVVSPERVTDELSKIWQSQDALYSFMLIQQTGLAHHIFRGFSFLKSEKWLKFYQLGLDQIARDAEFGWRWLAFCEMATRVKEKSAWSAGAAEILKVFSNFKLSRDLLASIDFSLRNYSDFEKRDTEALLLLDHRNGPALLQVASLERKLLGQVEYYENFVNRYRELSGTNGFLQTAFLNGRDIETLGVGKGPIVGELLKGVYKAQLEGVVADREAALEWVRAELHRHAL